MKKVSFYSVAIFLSGLFSLLLLASFTGDNEQSKTMTGGEMTFTIRTVSAGGNFAPKHVLAIWVEDADGFVKTRMAYANQRKQYLYTWHASSNYNVVDAITGPTLTSHQTHTVTWNFTDLDGNLVPDGDYTVWAEFTDKHAQGPLYTLNFTKGPNAISLTPPDETYFKDISFDFTPITAAFSNDLSEICQWETVTFTDESVNAQSWDWEFGEGAAPATANTQGPHTVYYTTPGSKTVSLTVNGELTETKEDLIQVDVQPDAAFDYAGTDYTVEFTNNSAGATSYLWDFGDGNTGTDENPTHTYFEAGEYTVSLSAINLDCMDFHNENISVPLVGINPDITSGKLNVFPNPANGLFNIIVPAAPGKTAKITIYNTHGSIVKEIPGIKGMDIIPYQIDMTGQPKGLYLVNLKSETMQSNSKLILK